MEIPDGELPHYSALLKDREERAYYLICKEIPVAEDITTMDTADLIELHGEYDRIFDEIITEGNRRRPDKNNRNKNNPNFLDLKLLIVLKILAKCSFCENKCGTNRYLGTGGRCGMGVYSPIESAFLHLGEEYVLVPSGTIFFAGCTFDCVFCQNYDISTIGKRVKLKEEIPREVDFDRITPDIIEKDPRIRESSDDIRNIAERLVKRGARNINYVGGDPTPHLHNILCALKKLDVNICMLWNSNFYNTETVVDILYGVMDFWLPDFKYGNNECGKKYSGINNYFNVITRNLKRIYNRGTRDIIIRHLVMPGHIECCSRPILEWIAENIPEVHVNIMGQYHPDYRVSRVNYPEINRRPTRAEMDRVFGYAEKLKIKYRLASK